VIPDAAVEAAAKVLWDKEMSAPWGKFPATFHAPFMRDARAALEAAAPHMLTRVTNAVINRAFEDGQASALARLADAYDEGLEAGDGLRPRGNPYI